MTGQHAQVLELIKEALAEQGRPLKEHEFQRMQRFLTQLDAANGPQRVAQVLAAYSDPDDALVFTTSGANS